jgi:hypothetical protein
MKKHMSWIDEFVKASGFKPIVNRKSAQWIDGKLVPCDLVQSFIDTIVHNVNNHQDRMQASTQQRRDMVRELESLHKALQGLSANTRELLTRNTVLAQQIAVALPMDGEGSIMQAIEHGVATSITQCKAKSRRGATHGSDIRRMFVYDSAMIYLMLGGKTLSSADNSNFALFLRELDRHCKLGLNYSDWRNAINESLGDSAPKRNAQKQRILRRIQALQ